MLGTEEDGNKYRRFINMKNGTAKVNVTTKDLGKIEDVIYHNEEHGIIMLESVDRFIFIPREQVLHLEIMK